MDLKTARKQVLAVLAFLGLNASRRENIILFKAEIHTHDFCVRENL